MDINEVNSVIEEDLNLIIETTKCVFEKLKKVWVDGGFHFDKRFTNFAMNMAGKK